MPASRFVIVHFPTNYNYSNFCELEVFVRGKPVSTCYKRTYGLTLAIGVVSDIAVFVLKRDVKLQPTTAWLMVKISVYTKIV